MVTRIPRAGIPFTDGKTGTGRWPKGGDYHPVRGKPRRSRTAGLSFFAHGLVLDYAPCFAEKMRAHSPLRRSPGLAREELTKSILSLARHSRFPRCEFGRLNKAPERLRGGNNRARIGTIRSHPAGCSARWSVNEPISLSGTCRRGALHCTVMRELFKLPNSATK